MTGRWRKTALRLVGSGKYWWGSVMRVMMFLMFALLVFGSASAQTPPAAHSGPSMPDGAGKPIIQKQCVMCHTLSVVTSKHASHDEWDQVVNQMVSRGAELTDEEVDTVVAYLAKNYGPLDKAASSTTATTAGAAESTATPEASAAATPVNINKASAQDLETTLGFTKAESEMIVQYRAQHGDFKTWKDVAAVPGGPSSAKVEGIEKQITF
jgi:competence ComEA-like helix-hairpin-helix protein